MIIKQKFGTNFKIQKLEKHMIFENDKFYISAKCQVAGIKNKKMNECQCFWVTLCPSGKIFSD